MFLSFQTLHFVGNFPESAQLFGIHSSEVRLPRSIEFQVALTLFERYRTCRHKMPTGPSFLIAPNLDLTDNTSSSSPIGTRSGHTFACRSTQMEE
jgi:hypothetical protein